ncbi:uncharacterized protein METZ01_LOCUS355430 [marine metagenome]|uniref:Uncharacterized protein n=1 Tax=marine metagenome TaxID=408172 RepID=A0A382RY26_9ZZZZ
MLPLKRSGEIFISPDGGETVYVQKKNGERGRLVSQSQSAKDIETAYDEQDMIGEDAVKIRRENPTLQNAWDRYVTIWHLINDNE